MKDNHLNKVMAKLLGSIGLTLIFSSLFEIVITQVVVNAEELGVASQVDTLEPGQCAPYYIDSDMLQPFDIRDNITFMDYDWEECVSVNSTFGDSNLEKRWWWITLGLALFKTADTILHWDNIYDECRHFTGSWKNGLSCIWDILSTLATYAGWAKKGFPGIAEAAEYIGTTGRVIGNWYPYGKRDGYKYQLLSVDANDATNPVPDHISDVLQGLTSALTGSRGELMGVVYAAGNITGEVMVAAKNSHHHKFSHHSGMLLTLTTDNVTTKHFIAPSDGATFYNMMSTKPTDLSKRDEPRYQDEYFDTSGYGVTSYICHNDYDAGQSNLDGDYVTWRDDLKCHSDIGGHSGVYVQGYDNNNQGTLFSYSAAPYSPGHKGILERMTQCPGGIGHQCGRTN